MDYCYDNTVDDGRFRVTVEQTGNGYSGILRVIVVETGEELLNEDVGVVYAARFGPDVDDVAQWQGKALGVIDAWIERQ